MDARYKIAEAMMRGVGQPMAAFPDQRQDADMSLRGMASDLYQADQRRAQDYRAGISDALMQSWPAELAKSAYGAVTLPGDVYAGKVNPMSDEAVGRAAEFAGLMTLGAGGIPAGKNEMRMGIKAYHGSPHDFDQFSMSKIGTGEGAQAYGHGLYFAGDESVAKSYREQLSKGKGAVSSFRVGGKELPTSERSVADIAHIMQQYNINPRTKEGRDWLSREIGARGLDGSEVRPRISALLKQPIEKQRLAGRMYEVNLNTTPDRLLDWDAPLAQQPDIVRRLTKEAYYGDPPPRLTGKDILEQVFTQVGPARRSEAMREAGIPGIKYLDAGSRGFKVQNTYKGAPYSDPVPFATKQQADDYAAEQIAKGFGANVIQDGSRNYVMFDDKLVQILRKYGVATAAALPAAALAELGMSREEAKRSF